MSFIATLNAVLVDGRHNDIIAIAVVENEEEGELWYCENKPEDGTQVDYVLHDIETVFAAPDLLEACKAVRLELNLLLELAKLQGVKQAKTVQKRIIQVNTAIAKTEET